MIQMVSEGKCRILVMLDLSAAFDTVVHEYLLSDLKFIGIDGSAYRWFESYLQNREVTVVVSQSKSETRKLTNGVLELAHFKLEVTKHFLRKLQTYISLL